MGRILKMGELSYRTGYKNVKENMSLMKRKMEAIKKNPVELLGKKNTVSEMKFSLDGINSRLDPEEKK